MGMSRRRRIASSNRRGSVRGCSFTISTVKKELFNYLIDYAIDTTMDEFFSLFDANERDFIERMRQIVQVKIWHCEIGECAAHVGRFVYALL